MLKLDLDSLAISSFETAPGDAQVEVVTSCTPDCSWGAMCGGQTYPVLDPAGDW